MVAGDTDETDAIVKGAAVVHLGLVAKESGAVILITSMGSNREGVSSREEVALIECVPNA